MQVNINEDLHKPGLSGFMYLYFKKCKRDFKKSLKYSGLLTLLFLVVFFLSKKCSLSLLNNLLSISLKVSPSLLAFTLAGYAVIMGRGVENLKKVSTNSGLSMYQKLNTTFIAMLMATLICLIVTVVLSFISSSEISSGCIIIDDIANLIAFTVTSFLLSYMLFAIKDLISNLFSMGQFMEVHNKLRHDK